MISNPVNYPTPEDCIAKLRETFKTYDEPVLKVEERIMEIQIMCIYIVIAMANQSNKAR